MGLDSVSTFDDLRRRLEDPSIWPQGEEGVAARGALLAAVTAATRHVSDDAERLEKAKRILGSTLKALDSIPVIRSLAGLI